MFEQIIKNLIRCRHQYEKVAWREEYDEVRHERYAMRLYRCVNCGKEKWVDGRFHHRLDKVDRQDKKNQSSKDERQACGARCEAIPSDAKIVPSGRCGHPDKRPVPEEIILDGLPIPEHLWTHCVFCKGYGDCYFAGICNHKLPL